MVGEGSDSTLTQINAWIWSEVRDEGGQPSSSSIIHQCAEPQTARRGAAAALLLTSVCFCLHTHTRAVRRTHHTLLTPAAVQTWQVHRPVASGRRAIRPEPGEVLRLWILRGGIKLPRGADGQQQDKKNIMKLKISCRFFRAAKLEKWNWKRHFSTLDSPIGVFWI